MLGILEISDSLLRKVAAKSCEKGETIHNFSFKVDVESVMDAIKLADKLG